MDLLVQEEGHQFPASLELHDVRARVPGDTHVAKMAGRAGSASALVERNRGLRGEGVLCRVDFIAPDPPD